MAVCRFWKFGFTKTLLLRFLRTTIDKLQHILSENCLSSYELNAPIGPTRGRTHFLYDNLRKSLKDIYFATRWDIRSGTPFFTENRQCRYNEATDKNHRSPLLYRKEVRRCRNVPSLVAKFCDTLATIRPAYRTSSIILMRSSRLGIMEEYFNSPLR